MFLRGNKNVVGNKRSPILFSEAAFLLEERFCIAPPKWCGSGKGRIGRESKINYVCTCMLGKGRTLISYMRRHFHKSLWAAEHLKSHSCDPFPGSWQMFHVCVCVRKVRK